MTPKVPTEYTHGITNVTEFNEDNRARFPDELGLMYLIYYSDRCNEYIERMSPGDLEIFLDKLGKDDVFHFRIDEIVVRYFMRKIEVDGIEGTRARSGIHNPSFFSIKPVPDPTNEDDTFYDSPYRESYSCLHCKADWVMNEETYLLNGLFICSVCGTASGAFA